MRKRHRSALLSATPPAAPEPRPALYPSQATSKAFWALTDRWHVPDDKPLQLLDHVGSLTATGRRLRFAMTSDEVKRFAYLTEIDATARAGHVRQAGGDS